MAQGGYFGSDLEPEEEFNDLCEASGEQISDIPWDVLLCLNLPV